MLPDEWISENIKNNIEFDWPDNSIEIFDNVRSWSSITYFYAMNKKGERLTRSIGPAGNVIENNASDSTAFFNLSTIFSDYLSRISRPAAANITIELEDEILLIAEFKAFSVVASFDTGLFADSLTEGIYQQVTQLQNAEINQK